MNKELEAFLKSLNGLDVSNITGPLKDALAALKAEAGERLAKLNLIDAVPAAQDFGWAFRSLTSAVQSVSQMATDTTNRMASLNGQIESGVTAKIATDGLVAKTAHESALATAREQASKDGFAKGVEHMRSLNGRGTEITTAGLIAPPAAILELEAEKFTLELTAAKDRLKQIKDAKLDGLKSLCGTVWDKAAFEASIATAKERGTTDMPNLHNTPPDNQDKNQNGRRKAC